MKVHSLWIRDYRVLRDLEIQFSPDSRPRAGAEGEPPAPEGHALDLLVGVNGTGKSTVLRALVEVLDRIGGRTSPSHLAFRITYEPRAGERVTITNFDRETNQKLTGFRVWAGDAESFQTPDDVRHHAPPVYVTYTTGHEAARAALSADVHADELRKATGGEYWRREDRIDAAPEPPPPADAAPRQGRVDITVDDLELVALCGLLQEPEPSPDHALVRQARQELRIRRLASFALRIHAIEADTTPEMAGTLRTLQRVAPRTRVNDAEYTFVFDLRASRAGVLDALCQAFGVEGPVGLYRRLAEYRRDQPGRLPLLARVDLFLEREPVSTETPALHTYRWLSDGERTFLSRMCLLSLFGSADALILLDEPEVHFNDYWKRKMVRLVDAALAGAHSHAIIATHSSIVLTDAHRRQITVLDRDGDGYTRRPLPPGIATFAGDPSDVLMNVFGAEAAAGAKSVDEVRKLLESYDRELRRGMPTTELTALHARLLALKNDLGPGYWRFRVADALARWRE